MRKLFIVYLAAALILCITFFYIKRAYSEWSEYSSLMQRASNVLITFEDIGAQVSNAAVLTPELASTKSSSRLSMFSVDKKSMIANLDKLLRLVKDSINVQIAAQLNAKLRPEIDWILKSNVADSILHHHADPRHGTGKHKPTYPARITTHQVYC